MDGTRGASWTPRQTAWAALALSAVAVSAVGQLVDDHPSAPAISISLTAAIAISFTAMAGVILIGVPGHVVGRLMAATGIVAGANVLAASWSSWTPLAWLSQWSWWPPIGLVALTLLLFPDGRLPSRRWRPVAGLVALGLAVATVALAVAALDNPHDLVSARHALTGRAQLLKNVAKVAVLATGAGLVGAFGALLARWRRADGLVRQQLICLFSAGLVFLLAMVLDAAGLTGAFLLAAVAVPVAMTIAILRYRLYGLDRIINRTVVWLVMTVLVVLGFLAIVALLRDVLVGASTSQASLVATGGIAVTFDPVRRRVQRAVNHLLYGERDDPYKVITRLGDLLGQTLHPADVLPLLTETIVRSLQVPYVAVELEERDGPRIFAEYGELTTEVQTFEMVTMGERVGRLLVATRSVGGHFTGHECRLLEGVALHAAVAAEATRLTRELEDSRGRLIVAQDKERARLWRELHDGVGSALTGMAMQVRAARKCAGGTDRLITILDGLATDLQDCRGELRQLIDQLQPHALDRGLEEALRAECRRFTGPALRVDLDVTDDLRGIPVAIQAAAHRIVAEALHNVARHAKAETCTVTVERRRSLSIEVLDNGIGFVVPRQGGVGLHSMRERASELGGDCSVTSVRPHGTAVRVQLPIAPTSSPRSRGDQEDGHAQNGARRTVPLSPDEVESWSCPSGFSS